MGFERRTGGRISLAPIVRVGGGRIPLLEIGGRVAVREGGSGGGKDGVSGSKSKEGARGGREGGRESTKAGRESFFLVGRGGGIVTDCRLREVCSGGSVETVWGEGRGGTGGGGRPAAPKMEGLSDNLLPDIEEGAVDNSDDTVGAGPDALLSELLRESLPRSLLLTKFSVSSGFDGAYMSPIECRVPRRDGSGGGECERGWGDRRNEDAKERGGVGGAEEGPGREGITGNGWEGSGVLLPGSPMRRTGMVGFCSGGCDIERRSSCSDSGASVSDTWLRFISEGDLDNERDGTAVAGREGESVL